MSRTGSYEIPIRQRPVVTRERERRRAWLVQTMVCLTVLAGLAAGAVGVVRDGAPTPTGAIVIAVPTTEPGPGDGFGVDVVAMPSALVEFLPAGSVVVARGASVVDQPRRQTGWVTFRAAGATGEPARLEVALSFRDRALDCAPGACERLPGGSVELAGDVVDVDGTSTQAVVVRTPGGVEVALTLGWPVGTAAPLLPAALSEIARAGLWTS